VKFLPSGNTQKKKSQLVLGRMETAFSFDRKPDDEASEEVHIGLEFMGHYAEPPLRISYKVALPLYHHQQHPFSIQCLLSLISWKGKLVTRGFPSATTPPSLLGL